MHPVLHRLVRQLPAPARSALRGAQTQAQLWRDTETRRALLAWRAARGDRRLLRWPEAVLASAADAVECNVCGWRGAAFGGVEHCESAPCPVCGSIGRDRFLYWCWTQRTAYDAGATLLETSPRLGAGYRARMAERLTYLSSDFDLSAHKADLQLDLQDIALPDSSVDVVLTPHVLEHVPDTDRALRELRRILRPGGDVFLQVPFPQAKTAPPPGPEYHGDGTLVHWRFGWDLADRVREHGFACTVLVPVELRDAAAAGRSFVYHGDDCDVDDLMSGAGAVDLHAVADAQQTARHGFRPVFQFITLHLRKAEFAGS
ncbi:MAG: Methyltransferase type 11 [Frankiales bacterium]|jgi:SAM-dependent methyltransferase|nr:Methyltransferase type 11 [Frankiales bacterium]